MAQRLSPDKLEQYLSPQQIAALEQSLQAVPALPAPVERFTRRLPETFLVTTGSYPPPALTPETNK